MEIIIDCDNKGLAKAMADALSKQTGIARDNFKESTDDVDTSVDATRDKSGVDYYQLGTYGKAEECQMALKEAVVLVNHSSETLACLEVDTR